MSRQQIAILVIVAVSLLSLSIRALGLELRPLHTDEAVHMVKAGMLLETGDYLYNPHEYHGPTLYYLAMPALWLTGAGSIGELKTTVPFFTVPLMAGAAIILLLIPLLRGFGAMACVASAVLFAASPAMNFYSRYYIQEMLVLAITSGIMAWGWKYTNSRRLRDAIVVAVLCGIGFATKESFVIIICGLLVGGMGARIYAPHHMPHTNDHFVQSHFLFRLGGQVNRRHILAGLLVMTFTALALLSTFFMNPSALTDAIDSYFYYTHRAGTGDSSTHGAAVHVHSWDWYFRLLLFFRNGPGPWWSEAVIVVLAVIGIISAMRLREEGEGNAFFLSSLAFYTLFTTLIFTLLPYKTPWNVLPMLHAMILSAGVGFAALWQASRGWGPRVLLLACFIAGTAHLGRQSWLGSTRYNADYRNPYVYAGTAVDVQRLSDRIQELAALSADGYQSHIHVIAPASDYWPLPWYLRQFRNVGYWNDIPSSLDAPLIIANSDLDDKVKASLHRDYHADYYGLRADVLMTLYVKQELWEAFMATRQ